MTDFEEHLPSRWRRVFYPLRHGALVTDTWFVADGRRFPIRELESVGWRMGSVQAKRRATLEIIGVEAVLVVAVVVVHPSAATCLVGILYLLVTSAMLGLANHRWPTPLQLWAVYHGEPTIIYTSTDPRTFHQVARALQRAIEHNRRAML